ncbi:DUF1573 domain-containing protein [Algoriphagus namhaensis]|uniref:DUF1573 domain-containing protein n=1 Tax=Algoriphagus namhaensis TaxID=915353 RepID=A0ABV8AWX4_9BACT
MNIRASFGLTVLYILLSVFDVSAQEAEIPKTIWEVNRVNLGTILAEQGPQIAEFKFTHTQDSILVIEEVLTDCGCTTAEYTSDSLKVGEEGLVKISFDPVTAAGPFSRMIIVKGNLHSVEDTLFVEGTAIPFPQNPLIDYPVKRLDLGFRQSKVNVGQVFTNEPKLKAIEIFNFGSQTLRADSIFFMGPEYLYLVGATDSIPSKSRGLVQIAYDGAMKNDLGFFEDDITLGWKGADSVRLDVIADVFEYFPPIPREDFNRVPQLLLSTKEIDFKDISPNEVQEEEVMLTNRGQQVLEIRKIQGNCTCLNLEMSGTQINPGESLPLSIKFDPRGRLGRDQRNIYVFSNDPINPVQLILLKSRIE